MSNSPIFDAMVREFQQKTGRTYADLCRPTQSPIIASRVHHLSVLNRTPASPFVPQDADTMQIPRVVPNVA